MPDCVPCLATLWQLVNVTRNLSLHSVLTLQFSAEAPVFSTQKRMSLSWKRKLTVLLLKNKIFAHTCIALPMLFISYRNLSL